MTMFGGSAARAKVAHPINTIVRRQDNGTGVNMGWISFGQFVSAVRQTHEDGPRSSSKRKMTSCHQGDSAGSF
jgi:hypothetical protein